MVLDFRSSHCLPNLPISVFTTSQKKWTVSTLWELELTLGQECGSIEFCEVLDQLIPSVSNKTTPQRTLKKKSSSHTKSETKVMQRCWPIMEKAFIGLVGCYPNHSFNDASLLYAFCRHVDDLADEASDSREAKTRLDQLRQDLWSEKPKQPLNQAFRKLIDGRSTVGERVG